MESKHDISTCVTSLSIKRITLQTIWKLFDVCIEKLEKIIILNLYCEFNMKSHFGSSLNLKSGRRIHSTDYL